MEKMEKVIYKKEGIKRIQVNENGDYIELDLMDIELPLKVMSTEKELVRQHSIYNNRCKAIEKQYKDNENLKLTNLIQAEKDYSNKCREILDALLGKDACLKIFREENRYGMFDDYFEQLYPVLENIVIDINAIKDKLVSKYKVDKDVIK